MIDTSFRNNVRHVRPYLGILLIGSMALAFGLIIKSAMTELSGNLYAATPLSGIEGVLELKIKGDIHYGDTISFSSDVTKLSLQNSNIFVTTACFQKTTMVFEKSVPLDGSVHLYDQAVSEYDWDGKRAVCGSTLMYRSIELDDSGLHVVDSVGFEVQPRGY